MVSGYSIERYAELFAACRDLVYISEAPCGIARVGDDVASEDEAVRSGLASTGITENFDLIGASLVTLTGRDGSFDLEHLYYNERENGDFSVWVRW